MKLINTAFSLFLILSYSNLYARTLKTNNLINKKVIMEISRTNYNEEQANEFAKKNLLSKPDENLDTGDGVKYKDCRVKKQS